jgi:Holliday junction resolvasome RuvABC endonuclease subunit
MALRDVLGIDPGPAESAYALVTEEQRVLGAGKVGNDSLIERIRQAPPAHIAVESIQSYGMAVGRSVFDTCFFIGELIRTCKDAGIPFTLYPRPEYTRRICGVGKVNDAVLRQALLLRFGGDRKGEPLFLLKGCTDKRSAFAVAVYHLDVRTEPVCFCTVACHPGK